jgi:hypothetical protein
LLEGDEEGLVKGNEVGPELSAAETLGIPLQKFEGPVDGSYIRLSALLILGLLEGDIEG